MLKEEEKNSQEQHKSSLEKECSEVFLRRPKSEE